MDLLLFYITFEAILIPFFIYIGIAGYKTRRIHAAYLFFFYTLVGSFMSLIAIFFILLCVGSTDVEIIWNTEFLKNKDYIIWISLFITFAVKVPMFPFHIWLPEAHVEAPTEGSVLLAGLLLKLGTYGILRFLLPTFYEISYYFSPLVVTISSIGVIYTSFSTLRQIDIKRVIAYSSISHMNMCMIGLFSFNEIAYKGSIFLLIAHGITSVALFFIIGSIYNRFNTKIIHYFGGMIYFAPILCFLLLTFTLSNISFPLTSNFIGELAILIGIYYTENYVAVFAAIIGIFLCTIYSMILCNKIIFLMPKYKNILITDLFITEIITLMPLLFLI